MLKKGLSVVIIGINVERYLKNCIDSIYSAELPVELLQLIYVDGGSIDRSIEIAKSYQEVELVELTTLHPTPGMGRNAGLGIAKYEHTLFLDADTELVKGWFDQSVLSLKGDVVAVCGRRKEKYPQKNWYHLVVDIEWNNGEGIAKSFGGDVLVNTQFLCKIGGYDEELVGGEDPEASYRVRENSGLIYRTSETMTIHDINMSNVWSYFKRAYRTGYGYAAVSYKFIKKEEKMWLREVTRIIVRSSMPFFFLIIAWRTSQWVVWGSIFMIFVCKPMFQIRIQKNRHQISFWKSVLYCVHLSIVVFPQGLGVYRFILGEIINYPLKNHSGSSKKTS